MINRLVKDKIAQRLSQGLLGITSLVIVLIVVGLVWKALPLLSEFSIGSILTESVWAPLKGKFGFLSFILGTIWVTLLSLIIAVPLCILASVYLVEYASDRLRNMVLPLVNVLAAIPPVLYGVWGVLFVVPLLGTYIAPIFGISSTGYSVFAGGIVLAVMIFPIMVSIMVEVLNTIPYELRAVSLSLGATRWETIKHVILKKAKPGIFAAVVLAISRAFGETVAVLMVCGNIPQIPKSIFDAGYPIPALIANNFGEMMSIPLYDSALMFAALLLFVIIFGFNLISRLILNKLEAKY
ncbi:phosphate ABC transporter permease subunit PstC [Sphingobacterium sp. DK4209]|uniref:Phosphate transport system permease protein n=1 Tax=Sphingobacterium zhuxiongii TaxID=2662364 RepID=A0A5Q0QCK1_9SPHI|nr:MULTISPECIES: phosphate ABC transporter permease subunit PstC [unclassified Sphingobacterium]MVZ66184.1 phosphate ABC transporter permease subunit PstC [Sphingobacterium sp. DK4209]QGA26601.1 phosphate ABC transporter permease subunit PstC [Sphingobacterium sp. dk4302]